jgi:putative transposase
MTKEEKIVAAVSAYNSGGALNGILTRFKCSKSWLYKWIKRYKGDPSGPWYVEQSRRPKTIHSTVSEQERQAVIAARQSLEGQPYAQRGAISIQYELRSRQQPPVPVWKINKILKTANLNHKVPRDKKRVNEYPLTGPITDQMDFVGPRYVKNDGRFYSLNIIDTTTHFVQVNILRGRETANVLHSVVRFWQQRGMPDFLQMDNELSFRGSNRHPHSFGKLIRLALGLRITPVFIPVREPWRNGIIEKFNDSFKKRFLNSQEYSSFAHMADCAREFETFHNGRHRYGANKGRTPEEQASLEMERDMLPQSFVVPENDLPLDQGKIILIRFIRSDLVLDIFGERFLLPRHLEYCYVQAVISIEDRILTVLRDNRVQWQTFYMIGQSTM